MSKQDFIRTNGRVTEALGGDRFMVELDNGLNVLGTLCGRIRQNHIRVIPGDRVDVEISPYDLTRCRISYRHTKK